MKKLNPRRDLNPDDLKNYTAQMNRSMAKARQRLEYSRRLRDEAEAGIKAALAELNTHKALFYRQGLVDETLGD